MVPNTQAAFPNPLIVRSQQVNPHVLVTKDATTATLIQAAQHAHKSPVHQGVPLIILTTIDSVYLLMRESMQVLFRNCGPLVTRLKVYTSSSAAAKDAIWNNLMSLFVIGFKAPTN